VHAFDVKATDPLLCTDEDDLALLADAPAQRFGAVHDDGHDVGRLTIGRDTASFIFCPSTWVTLNVPLRGGSAGSEIVILSPANSQVVALTHGNDCAA